MSAEGEGDGGLVKDLKKVEKSSNKFWGEWQKCTRET